MCLRVKDPTKIKTTGKERVFYKILAVVEGKDDFLVTPYIGQGVCLGGTNYTCQDGFDFVERRDWFEVTRGGFHLFKNLKDAENEARWMNDHFIFYNGHIREGCVSEYRVYKAIVPKGTTYIEGTFHVFSYPSVVVKEVRYEEI